MRGDPASGRIALTFDQGLKDPGTTGKLLDLLRQHNIQATFFLTGEWTAANPELAGRIVSDGHEVGNHTYDHANLTEVSPEEMRSQLGRTYAVLKDLGIDDALRPYFRAPFGATDQAVLQTAADEGYRTIHWTLDSGDWRPEMSAQDVIDRLTAEAKPGDIIVAHGYSAKTYDAFSAAIPFLLGKGYALGSLSALLGP